MLITEYITSKTLTLRLFLNGDIDNDLTHPRLELLLNTSSFNLNQASAYKLKLNIRKLKH